MEGPGALHSDIGRYLPCSDPDTGRSLLPDELPQQMVLRFAFIEPGSGNRVKTVHPPPDVSRVEVELLETSTFDGQAMNWPPIDVPASGPDFFLRQGVQATDALFDQETGIATVPLSCDDYGGSTTVRATAGGQVSELAIPIPQANPTSPPLPKIGWAATPSGRVDSAGRKAADDLDANPAVSGLPARALVGDGLTVFGEYRGFVAEGQHIRTDPTIKDVFLRNTLPESALTGIASLGLAFHNVVDQEYFASAVVGQSGEAELRLIDFRGDPVIRAGSGQGVIRLLEQAGTVVGNTATRRLGETNGDLTRSSFSPDSTIFTSVITFEINRKKNLRVDEGDLRDWVASHELGHAAHICHRKEDSKGRPVDELGNIITDGRCPEDGGLLIPQARLPRQLYFMHSGTVIDNVLQDNRSRAQTPSSFHSNSLEQIRLHPN